MAKSPYLDFDVIARISNMQLLAKVVVEGFILGLHRSPYRGFSVEFAEYRQYTAGDEIKHIDWKVYGKTDRYYIKQFEEETNLTCHILLDSSGSMAYKSRETGLSKLQYGSCLAACLSYFMMRQRDATGLTVFDTKARLMLPPRTRQSHLHRILTELDHLAPGGETNVAGPLHDLAESLKRTGLIILISDLLDDPQKVLSALQHFRFKGHDIIVFQVMDDAELTFPFDTMTEFTDLETNEKLLVAPEGIKPVYMAELKRFLSSYEKGCADLKADYKLFDTRTPLELGLSEYLHRRSQMN
ncbi:MAG TPA: DUF58 domain-containing protein [Planctomycetota bacterium]|nr:DUF58 domain-containing protein [Planctomycetota bacterium]HRR82477.1 DUF58 domain-containing protein [Planctomycetota bacterium]HRT94301.1 DUF58 domain-containing protein [Planctomycetota bacterium]